MSEPIQTCQLCGRVEAVMPVGRSFPPDAAKRRLKKRCEAAGCNSQPQYTAGVALGGPAVAQAEARAVTQGAK